MTTLYRAYDGSGRLLYVGISDRSGSRRLAHPQRSLWRDQVARWEYEQHPTRQAALAAKAAALATEWPVHNRGRSPQQRRAEQREYVQTLVSGWPELTADQRSRVREVLAPILRRMT
jgi:hypothetical protein